MVKDGISILFVEDDPAMQTLFSILAGSFADTIISAGDGVTGLEKFRQSRPDLVITDIQMPGMSGMDMLRNIRQIDPGVPCIILSAYSIPQYFIEAIEIGVQGFLLKPLRREQLHRLLEQLRAGILAERRIREQEMKRLQAEEDLRKLNEELENRVTERTLELKQENLERQKAEEELISLNRNLEKRVQEEFRKREKQQQLLIQKSKLESMGELAAGMAHELNQPLAGISMSMDNVQYHLKAGKISREYLERKLSAVFADIERIRHLIDHVRTFSREQGNQSQSVMELRGVVQNALSLVETQYRNHQVNIILHLGDDPLYSLGNPFKMEQVLLNLLSNAKYAVDAKGNAQSEEGYHKEIMISLMRHGDEVVLELSDNGHGIPGNAIDRIFDPFFTTKEQEVGTGLGLSIVYGIIQDMGGDITVRSKPGVFTTMTVRLPYIREEQEHG